MDECTALLFFLSACGGVAPAEELFSDVPSLLAPPPYCTQGAGECSPEPGPIQIGPAPPSDPGPAPDVVPAAAAPSSTPLSHSPPDVLDPAPFFLGLADGGPC